MRIYELMFIVDPRVSDEDVVSLTDDVKKLIETGGGNVPRQESWGRRKLAYPIDKTTEGKYVLLYVTVDGGSNPLQGVELRMQQNDKILRFMAVRTDREQDIEAAVVTEDGDAEGEG